MKDLDNKLEQIITKYKEIEKNLSKQNNSDTESLIRLNKEYAELTPLVEKVYEYQNCKKILKICMN